MKNFFFIPVLLSVTMLSSCKDKASKGSTNNSDSIYSGLEGSREEASHLSNAPIDTSSGQTIGKAVMGDSSANASKDSLPKK